MKLKGYWLKRVLVTTNIRMVLVASCLVLVLGCAYHPPAPVEEHSTGMVKRQLDADGSYYVRSGDTLYAIAFGYDVDPRDVAEWNGISSPYTIYPGQSLRLSPPPSSTRKSRGSSSVQISTVKTPGQATTRAITSPVSPPPTKSTSKTSTPTKAAPAKPVAEKSTTAPPAIKATKPASSNKVSTINTAEPLEWKWPARGSVLRTYVAGNPARNGLDIAGKDGQSIHASAGGQVVYSGNGLIGYGELIIIKHSEKMLSAYAHNKVRLVNEGEQVSAGQKIAEMGRNSSDEQLLHFEIRANGKPVDPLTYLPRR